MNLRPLLDLLAEDVDFHKEHGGEKNEEEKEGNHHAARLQVAHTNPCREHVLNGPRLASKFCNEPSTFAHDIGYRDADESCPMQPFWLKDVFLVEEEKDDDEEQDEEASTSHHYAESIEAHWDVGHDLFTVLDIAITKVFHVFSHDGACVIHRGLVSRFLPFCPRSIFSERGISTVPSAFV